MEILKSELRDRELETKVNKAKVIDVYHYNRTIFKLVSTAEYERLIKNQKRGK